MQRMGLTHAQLKAYHSALCAPHSVRIMVSLCDLDENPLESITPVVLSGQVTVNARSQVTRMLQMEFLDPHHELNIDTATPSDGALFIDRIVKVYYSVWVEDLGRHVTCQVFTGVPWGKLTRQGAVVTIEAHGKERLALRPAWRTFHRPKGATKTKVIRELLETRSGEGRFAFGEPAGTLATRFTVARQQLVWPRAKKLASSMDRQLFYPGHGATTLRKPPDAPVVTFRGGNGGALLDWPAVDTDVNDFVNTVHVKGRKNVDPVVVDLPPAHPMSARKLIRRGVPGVIARFEQNSQLKTKARAKDRGHRVLDKASREVVTHTYDVLPFPHLDELDLVRVVTPEGVSIRHRLVEFAIPLVTDGQPPMTVGYTRRLVPARKHIRKR